MLKKTLISVLSLGSKQVLRRERLKVFSQLSLIRNFCSNKNLPKGFEKFKRSSNNSTEKKNDDTQQNKNNKESEELKQNQNESAETSDTKPKNSEEFIQQEQDEKDKEKEKEKEKENEFEKIFNIKNEEDLKNFFFNLKKGKKGEKSEKGPEDGGKGPEEPKESGGINIRYFILGGIAAFIILQPLMDFKSEKNTVTYQEFVKNYLEKEVIDKIVIERLDEGSHFKANAKIYSQNKMRSLQLGNVDNFLEQLEKYQLEKGKSKDQLINIQYEYKGDSSKTIDRAMNIMYLVASIGILAMIFRSIKQTINQVSKGGGGSNIFGMGKSNIKIYDIDTAVKTKFHNVAGLDEAKIEIQEFVDFLKKPKKYKEMGARIPRGALLTGPPGTGKTLLAKACAGEAGVPFLYMSGSDFVEMFVGVGASRAKERAPSIIFIDEIDAVGRKRETKMSSNDERDNTLNQLLVEMDGFGTESQVIMLAATNRKDILDPALLRPGRFDRSIEINLPDIEARKYIFMVHLKPLKLDSSSTMEEYARRLSTLTPGFSGADIANLCNEAAILAARKNLQFITTFEFEMASERVIAGLEKKSLLSKEERKVVAVHESGHAVVSWFLEGGAPLIKLTIIPRSKGSLGYAQYLPNESTLETKEELLDRICCILGGRCAEEHFFQKITTGAYDDLKKAFDIANAIVTKFGMSEEIGYIGIPEDEYGQKRYSEETAIMIDSAVKRIIDEAVERTRQIIQKHEEQIKNLSDQLIEKETLDLRQIVSILGERPFEPKANYKAFLEIKNADQQLEEIERQKQKETEEAQKENQNQNDKDNNTEQKEVSSSSLP